MIVDIFVYIVNDSVFDTHYVEDNYIMFQLINLPKRSEDNDAPAGVRRVEAVAKLLEELAPHEKNLTCAVLV